MDSRLKEDLFYNPVVESSNISYSAETNNETNKSYIRKIYSLDIPLDIKTMAEKKILSCERRIHTLSDEVICVIVILSYQESGIPYNFEHILHIFNLNPSKSKILNLLSKATTKSTILDEINTSINIVIIKPSIYINELLDIYINKCGFKPSNLPEIQYRLKCFTEMLEGYYPPIQQYSPRETASAIIYKYFEDRLFQKKRSFFSKKIFSSLQPDMNHGSFDISLRVINEKIAEINLSNPGYLSQF